MQNTAGPGFKPGPSLLARMMPGTKVAAAKVPA